MRGPILNDIVNNFEKRPWSSVSSERVHDGLAFIVESREEDPRETKKENEAVEKQKGASEASLRIFIGLIEPEDLKEGDEWNEGEICIEG